MRYMNQVRMDTRDALVEISLEEIVALVKALEMSAKEFHATARPAKALGLRVQADALMSSLYWPAHEDLREALDS